jgi:GTPase
MKQPETPQKSGRIALIGKPNSGKSTLTNRFLNQDASIITHKAHTTQKQILGTKHHQQAEFIFVDTPGIILKRRSVIQKHMAKSITHAITDADIIICVTTLKSFGIDEKKLCQQLQLNQQPIILVINKVDLPHTQAQLDAHIQAFEDYVTLAAIVPISAKTGFNMYQLETTLTNLLPQRAWQYPNQTMQPALTQEQHASQLIRKYLLEQLHQELPYQTGVLVTPFKKIKQHLHIDATIIINQTSHKKIIIGKQGQTLKKIGSQTRIALEKWLQCKVHLKLFVKVDSNWINYPEKVYKIL